MNTCNRYGLFKRRRLAGALLGVFGALCAQPALAGIATDGTVGQAVNLAGPNFAIPATLGTQVGSNLFHSFSAFNIATGESATFSGPNGIANILARVTGGAQSSIDGVLASTISRANLYLVNPAGIVFGPNASLNIGGSFYASTANYVKLADGGRFDATNPAQDVLTTAPVAAFGFLGSNIAPIFAMGTLAVPQGESIGLIGGNIDLTNAALTANGGQIVLAAIASQAEVGVMPSGLDATTVTQFGNITASNSTLDVSEAANAATGSGSVYIRGGQIVLNNQSAITSNTSNGAAGSIDIAATGNLQADNSVIQATTSGTGNGGLISIATNALAITGGSQIDASANAGSSGMGGEIRLAATASMTISGSDANGFPSGVFVQANGSGSGGAISLSAAELNVTDSGYISSNVNGSGTAGQISINTGTLSLLNGGQIDSSAALDSSGNLGNIQISATDSISISGADANGNSSGIFGKVYGTGNGGSIDIKAKNLNLDNRGVISASTFSSGFGGAIMIDASNQISINNNGTIAANSYGIGDGGYISLKSPEISLDGGIVKSLVNGAGMGGYLAIDTGKLSLVNGARIDSSSSSGSSGSLGNIEIAATDSISISGADANGNASGIFGQVQGSGHGWAIDTMTGKPFPLIAIGTGNLSLLNGGAIDSSSTSGSSGSLGMIQIAATDSISISGADANGNSSGIFGKVYGTGDGGLIDIKAKNLNLDNQGAISASTFSSGFSGDIAIDATGAINLNNDGKISANSYGAGDAGWIALKSPEINLDGGLVKSQVNGSGMGGYLSIDTGKLSLVNGGQIDSSSSSGSTGDLGLTQIAATDSILISGTNANGTPSGILGQVYGGGNGGAIDISTGKLTISQNGTIDAGTFSSGIGGALIIKAANSIDISSGATIFSDSMGSGFGGYISLDAPSLKLDGGNIIASASATGDGGWIQATVGSMTLVNGASIDASTTGSGIGGYIDIVATRSVSLADQSRITSKSEGAGLAGSIAINAGLSYTSQNSEITTGATLADGGNISLIARDLIKMDNSSITATVGNGLGNGGNIFLDPLFVVMNGSTITANAFGGNGGNINLIANNFLQSSNSFITASSKLGVSGTVALNGQLADLSGSLASLPIAYLDNTGLLRARCAASKGGTSSFVLMGRGGIPPEPDAPAPSSPLLNASPVAAGSAPQLAALSPPDMGCGGVDE